MKNAIRYYYELEVNDLEFIDGKYFFDNYFLVEVDSSIDLSLYEYLKQWHFPMYEILPNKENNYLTPIDKKTYMLLKITKMQDVNYEILEQFTWILAEKKELPWHELWMKKVDSYEKYIELSSSALLRSSFFYYEGLAENAISFYRQIKHEEPLYLSHKRMNSDFDYWNPLNFTLDYRARDIAEYTKRRFFEGKFQIQDLFLYFRRMHFTKEEYLLFYARMLFPSYYFDCYDAIMMGKEDCCLECYFEKREAYEELLKTLYYQFLPYVFLPKIDWLIDS